MIMDKDDPISNLPPVENTDSSAVPQNSATGNFASDAGQQGIFSSSDTRIETENLPEIPEVVQQAPMSSISPVLRTESTVTGDLKLRRTSKKKKWPLVVLGVVVVAILAVGGVVLFGNQMNKNNAEGKVKLALNQFSNYYLYGTDSTDAIQGDYNKNTVYKAVIAIEERNVDFFNRAKEYYDSFIQAYGQDIRATQKIPDPESIDDYLSGDVTSFTEMFDFLYRFAMAPALTSEEIFGVLMNTDFESAEQFVNDHYSNLLDTTYEPGIRYAKERTIYDLSQVDQYRIYQENNCLDGESIKENCAIGFQKYDMSRIEEAKKIADSDILQLPDEVVEESIEQLFLIQKEEL